MLEFIDVTKQFDTVLAVNHVSFHLQAGSVLGVVGRNGAGKSTMFRMILDLIPPTSGTILYQGEPLRSDVLTHFGFLPEEGSLLPQFTVLDLCEYYGALKEMTKDEVYQSLMAWLQRFHLEDYLNAKIKTLSKGNRQKIQFIISVLHNPDFIILDEPFSGLDPVSVEELEQAILDLKRQGKTILFSSHIMSHVETLCDEILLLHHGEAVLQGNLQEILSQYQTETNASTTLNDIFLAKVGEEHESL